MGHKGIITSTVVVNLVTDNQVLFFLSHQIKYIKIYGFLLNNN